MLRVPARLLRWGWAAVGDQTADPARPDADDRVKLHPMARRSRNGFKGVHRERLRALCHELNEARR